MANKNIKMQQLKKDESTGKYSYETMHPETTSQQVLYDGKKVGTAESAGIKYSTTKGALDHIVDNLNNNIDGVSQAHIKIGELETKVNELGQAVVVDDTNDFYNNATNNAKFNFYKDNTSYRIGTQVLVVDTGTPDYWISAVFDASENFASTEYPPGSNYFRVGFYGLSVLEISVDLSPYQKAYDTTLATTSKTVPGAINEVNQIALNANAGMNNNATTLQNIVGGTTVVGKANYASSAATASVAENAVALEAAVGISVAGDVVGEEVMFDGSGDVTLNVNLRTTGVTAGTYSAVTVDTKGRVTAGTQFIEVGENINADASSSLPVNGIFFRRVS